MKSNLIKDFVDTWTGRGYEKGEAQPFWLSLLHKVLGVADPEKLINFEDRVLLEHGGFIDAYIPSTKVLIEQKGLGRDLRQAVKQSDGALLTPFQQAKRYSDQLPYSQRPRWIVVCNFAEFHIHDMEQPHVEPEVVLLKNLEKEAHRLRFLIDAGDDHIRKELEVSLKAGEIVGKIYDSLLEAYEDKDDPQTLHSLNILCVRLVFCLYAEDSGMFGANTHSMFHDYLKKYAEINPRLALVELFRMLDTKIEDRDKYIDKDLAAFPYVNGGLFGNETIQIPHISPETLRLILKHASEDFNWSDISPTIFGAVFESTLNPETRRKGGMHYTSIENIHKVIDPLFMDDLREEFNALKTTVARGGGKIAKPLMAKLRSFQDKLASLKFLDPACGSGNFLTETFISLRRLENEVVKLMTGGQAFIGLADFSPIKVNIHQFHGIEINDFAATVAKTALWIAESQMLKETESIIDCDLEFLPLKSYANIRVGNALRLDWDEGQLRIKNEELRIKSGESRMVDSPSSSKSVTFDYIMGNPPFVGYSLQSEAQKSDILAIYRDEKGKPYKTAGKIDYVSGWYWKAAELMKGTHTRAALVSTNSITQGEQVASVWKPLCERFGVEIDFAHRTFRWDSEAAIKAHVHCVIVGFSCRSEDKSVERTKIIFDGDNATPAHNINPYLIDSENAFIVSRNKPICDIPEMTTGNRPADGGNLIIEANEYEEFIKKEPGAKKFIKRLIGAEEYINSKLRYCLWLVDATPNEMRSMPLVMKRIEDCRAARLGGAPDRQKLAEDRKSVV